MGTQLLLIEDDPSEAEPLVEMFCRYGMSTDWVQTGEAALALLERQDVGVVVADVRLGGGISGIELCERLRAHGAPVIVVTGHRRMDVAVAALRAGAYDMITKPLAIDALLVTVQRALVRSSLVSTRRTAPRASSPPPAFAGIIGASPAIQRTMALVKRTAPSDATLLVTGETGTGKERIARSVHQLSERGEAPFVAVNCAAIPAGLIESELFGHVRGAFTDAGSDRPGRFVQARRGTLFLDEIADLSLELQVKLLRVLQTRRVRPVGGDAEVAFDARIICATHRDLKREIAAGRFREDLFYRIDVVGLHLPPLRKRHGDVVLLARHFLALAAGRSRRPARELSDEVQERLIDHDWPGNVRELENCIEHAVAVSREPTITVDDLPTRLRNRRSVDLVLDGDDPTQLVTLAEMSQRYVRKVLDAVEGNKSRAASMLDIHRRSLYRRLEDD